MNPTTNKEDGAEADSDNGDDGIDGDDGVPRKNKHSANEYFFMVDMEEELVLDSQWHVFLYEHRVGSLFDCGHNDGDDDDSCPKLLLGPP